MANPQYTRVADLPIGSQILMGKNKFVNKYQDGEEDIIWLVLSKDHKNKDDGYPYNALTLITKDVIRYMAFDAKEPQNVDNYRKTYGNPRWKTSNIRQWLNTNGLSGQWYLPQNLGTSGKDNKDTPPTTTDLLNTARNYPYDLDDGFMNFFNATERKYILPATIKTVIPIDSEGQISSAPQTELTTDYFYLPSLGEIAGTNFVYSVNHPLEGAMVLSDSTYRNAKATNLSLINGAYYSYALDTNKDYAYRSPANNGEILKYFDDGLTGSYVKGKPYDNYGIRPMTNLSYDAVVAEVSKGVYRLVDNAKPFIVIDKKGEDFLDFRVYDYDDNLSTVKIEINNELLETYNLPKGVKEFTKSYVIPYNKLFVGKNTMKITAIDERKEESIKTLNLSVSNVNYVRNGDELVTKDGIYTVVDTFINEYGVLELTLDRNLKSTNEKFVDKVEKYSIKFEPYVFVNSDLTALPQYQKMELRSVEYNKDNTATEEWQIIGFGNVAHTKVEFTRENETDTSSIKKVSQIFTFYEE